ncbi:hypothetical protein [Streptacidiphilus fuscans]|uniref:PepSY domain-containing protein n=1 Tax=Streptacidiphilus fuscans TaxID=2789292 RepID=A0A931B8Z7_9ACTN|nr:hypothetical protein [Streptacidiphilus fuscans]MBF9070857.1 hypothetical protein [Streptacidiphilus fuscans]
MTDPVDPFFPASSAPEPDPTPSQEPDHEPAPNLAKEPAPTADAPAAAAAEPASAGSGSGSGSGVRRRMGGRPARWVLTGVGIVVLVGGTAAVTAAVVNHGDRGFAVRAVSVAPGGIGLPGIPGGLPGKVVLGGAAGDAGSEAVVVKGGQAVAVPGAAQAGGVQGLAPAPLPSLPADQAADKAAAAVTGGKVESLTSVPEQGGGSAWQAVVLGPDGVSHLVTVDGTSGTITSNTTLGG